MNLSRWITLVIVAGLIGSFVYFDLGAYLTLENIKSEQARLQELLDANPLGFAAAFFLGYVAITALSIPGAAIMTLVAGALFGLGWGLLLVSFASTIGATLAMVIARWLFQAELR